ncbi:MAG: hypothetical protein INR72_08875 [Williamsia herbipolensis]|nr:hypothetical protein [Williamsia herbipolensis]
MTIRTFTTASVMAGAIGAAALGVGLGAATASAATSIPNGPGATISQEPTQARAVVVRPDYSPFVYKGVPVTPAYDPANQAVGFTYGTTFVEVLIN